MLEIWSDDIYEILSITQGGVDVTNKFDFDNGQKIDRYDFGRIILKQGEDVDTTANSLVVTCNKFTHAMETVVRLQNKVMLTLDLLD